MVYGMFNCVKRVMAVTIAVSIMCLSFSACNKKSPVSVKEEITHKRPLAQTNSNVSSPEVFEKEFTETSVEWSGPAGYTIVYANDNEVAHSLAKLVKEYFENNCNVTISIVADSAPKTKKEILIGNTNRCKTTLSEQEFAVSLKDEKLFFEGGHETMVSKAVKWFITLEYKVGCVNTLTGKANDFVSKLDNGYVYVWGDEFDGYGSPDKNYWDEKRFMWYGENFKSLDYNTEVTRVEDGRLKMSAIRYYDQTNALVQYANGTPLTTSEEMTYMYGYAEMRAKVPYVKGAWPAWWCKSGTSYVLGEGAPLNPYASTCIYDVELDIFEVFSSVDSLFPNLHKWYRNTYVGGKVYDKNGKDITDQIKGAPLDGLYHSSIENQGQRDGYTFANAENLKDEYHTYGFLWTPDKMEFSIDGKVYETFDLTESFDGYSNDDLNQYYFFILDCHLYTEGGKKVKNESLPIEMYVDYIRLYQLPGEGKILLGKME